MESWDVFTEPDRLQLVELIEGLELARSALDEQVRDMLRRGYSYGTIGSVFGISRQTAHERFRRLVA
jgi:hypothetical protein